MLRFNQNQRFGEAEQPFVDFLMAIAAALETNRDVRNDLKSSIIDYLRYEARQDLWGLFPVSVPPSPAAIREAARCGETLIALEHQALQMPSSDIIWDVQKRAEISLRNVGQPMSRELRSLFQFVRGMLNASADTLAVAKRFAYD